MRKYFDIELNILGHLYHDMHVIHSLRQRHAYYKVFPQSRNAASLNRMANQLITNLIKVPEVTVEAAL